MSYLSPDGMYTDYDIRNGWVHTNAALRALFPNLTEPAYPCHFPTKQIDGKWVDFIEIQDAGVTVASLRKDTPGISFDYKEVKLCHPCNILF